MSTPPAGRTVGPGARTVAVGAWSSRHVLHTPAWFRRALPTDLRCTARALRMAPVFTFAAITTLAIGIGAHVAMFGVVDRLLLRPPPHVWRLHGAPPAWTR